MGKIVGVAVLLSLAFIIVNVVHLAWTYANPEGFWSFQVFLDVLRTACFGLIFLVFGALALALLARNLALFLLSLVRKGGKKESLLKDAGFFIVALVLFLLNYVASVSLEYGINSHMADKYSYLSQSEKLIGDGRYSQALIEAERAYNQAKVSDIAPSPFFVLTRLYYASAYAEKERLARLYACTISYAFCLEQTGKFADKSIALYLEALKLSGSGGLRGDPQYKLLPLSNLSQLCLAQGRYQQAENYFSTVLGLSHLAEGEDADRVVPALSVFATRALELGQYEKAARLITYTLTLYEGSGSSLKSSYYIELLLSAGVAELANNHLIAAGRYIAKAQELVGSKKSKEVYLGFLRVKSSYCVRAAAAGGGDEAVLEPSLIERGLSLFRPKRTPSELFLAEANECLEELVAEARDRDGVNSLLYAESLVLLAQFYSYNKMFERAQPLNVEVLRLLRPLQGNQQELYYRVLLQSVATDYNSNQHQDFSRQLREIEGYYSRAIRERYVFFTEEEREQYVLKLASTLSSVNAIRINQDSGRLAEQVYNSVLSTKSVALFSNQQIRRFIAGSKGPIRNAYYRILAAKDELSRRKGSHNTTQLAGAENNLKVQEKALLRSLVSQPGFAHFDPAAIRWTDIRDALKEGETAVEIINAPRRPFTTDSLTYYALLTRRDYSRPKLVRLFEERELARLLNQPGTSEQRIDAIYGGSKEALFQTIWGPIAAEVANSSRVYLSVSGILHTVSFPALLLDRYPEVILLSSTRQIALPAVTPPATKAAALFGDIDYNYSAYSPGTPAARDSARTARSLRPLSHRHRFARLKYSGYEVAAIRSVIEGVPGNKARLFTDSLGSEPNFRGALKGEFNIIHVATHGFYLPGAQSVSPPYGYAGAISGGDESPLSRSGITLAGANNTVPAAPGNDGIVTAAEIAREDMAGVDMVVLSACETGLGTLKGSEGIYGLQRALKMAGVRSPLVSLWNVPDKQTAELMKIFYAQYASGQTKAYSLKRAQLEMRDKYGKPFYWAGFQLISD